MKLSDFPVDRENPTFIFVPEAIMLEGLPDTVPIGEHALLCRAPDEMKAGLMELLTPFMSMRMLAGINPWQSSLVSCEGGHVQVELTAGRNFWIVQYWRKLFDNELQQALEIADPGLTPLMTMLSASVRSTGQVNDHAIINWMYENLVQRTKSIGSSHISEIEDVMLRLRKLRDDAEPSLNFISKAVEEFADLKRVFRYAPIYVVGLF